LATIWYVSAYSGLSANNNQRNRHYRFTRALLERAHNVVVFTSDVDNYKGQARGLTGGDDYRDWTSEGLTTRVLRGREYLSTFSRFLGMIHFEKMVLTSTEGLQKPDLVIGKSIHPFAAHGARLLARRFKAPFVLELGDIWPQTLVDLGALKKTHPAYWILRWLELDLYRKAQRILSKIPYAKRHIGFKEGVPSKVVYLPNSVDLDPYLSPEYPSLPRQEHDFTVVYAGSTSPVYGLNTLVDAAAIVGERRPELPISFRIVGSGSSLSALKSYARSRNLRNLEFVGRIPLDDIPIELGRASLCIDLARDLDVVRKYGMSHNKIYEYMGSARPVIFAVASANDPIAEANAGLTVPPEDPVALAEAILELQGRTYEERLEMGRRAQEYVSKRYTHENMSERFALVIEEVLEGLEPETYVNADDLKLNEGA